MQHNIVSGDSVDEEDEDESDSLCTLHQEPLELFCLTCKSAICGSSACWNETNADKHEIIPYKYHSQLSLTPNIHFLQSIRDRITSAVNNLDEVEHFVKKAELLREVQRTSSSHSERLNKISSILENQRTGLENLTATVEDTIVKLISSMKNVPMMSCVDNDSVQSKENSGRSRDGFINKNESNSTKSSISENQRTELENLTATVEDTNVQLTSSMKNVPMMSCVDNDSVQSKENSGRSRDGFINKNESNSTKSSISENQRTELENLTATVEDTNVQLTSSMKNVPMMSCVDNDSVQSKENSGRSRDGFINKNESNSTKSSISENQRTELENLTATVEDTNVQLTSSMKNVPMMSCVDNDSVQSKENSGRSRDGFINKNESNSTKSSISVNQRTELENLTATVEDTNVQLTSSMKNVPMMSCVDNDSVQSKENSGRSRDGFINKNESNSTKSSISENQRTELENLTATVEDTNVQLTSSMKNVPMMSCVDNDSVQSKENSGRSRDGFINKNESNSTKSSISENQRTELENLTATVEDTNVQLTSSMKNVPMMSCVDNDSVQSKENSGRSRDGFINKNESNSTKSSISENQRTELENLTATVEDTNVQLTSSMKNVPMMSCVDNDSVQSKENSGRSRDGFINKNESNSTKSSISENQRTELENLTATVEDTNVQLTSSMKNVPMMSCVDNDSVQSKENSGRSRDGFINKNESNSTKSSISENQRTELENLTATVEDTNVQLTSSMKNVPMMSCVDNDSVQSKENSGRSRDGFINKNESNSTKSSISENQRTELENLTATVEDTNVQLTSSMKNVPMMSCVDNDSVQSKENSGRSRDGFINKNESNSTKSSISENQRTELENLTATVEDTNVQLTSSMKNVPMMSCVDNDSVQSKENSGRSRDGFINKNESNSTKSSISENQRTELENLTATVEDTNVQLTSSMKNVPMMSCVDNDSVQSKENSGRSRDGFINKNESNSTKSSISENQRTELENLTATVEDTNVQLTSSMKNVPMMSCVDNDSVQSKENSGRSRDGFINKNESNSTKSSISENQRTELENLTATVEDTNVQLTSSMKNVPMMSCVDNDSVQSKENSGRSRYGFINKNESNSTKSSISENQRTELENLTATVEDTNVQLTSSMKNVPMMSCVDNDSVQSKENSGRSRDGFINKNESNSTKSSISENQRTELENLTATVEDTNVQLTSSMKNVPMMSCVDNDSVQSKENSGRSRDGFINKNESNSTKSSISENQRTELEKLTATVEDTNVQLTSSIKNVPMMNSVDDRFVQNKNNSGRLEADNINFNETNSTKSSIAENQRTELENLTATVEDTIVKLTSSIKDVPMMNSVDDIFVQNKNNSGRSRTDTINNNEPFEL